MTPVLRSLPTRLVVALVVVTAALVPGPLGGLAAAQSPPAATATLELVGQPVFHGREDGLGLRVKVVNDGTQPLRGFQIQTSIYERIQSRTGLHDSFDGPSGFVVGGDVNVFSQTLDADDETVVEIDPPMSLFPGVSEEGVYPMTLTLQGASTAQLDSFTSELIFYPEPVEVPLNLALVVPIAPQPARGPTGAFEIDNAGNYPLEASLGEGEWLSGLLDAMEEGVRRGLRFGLAPSPRFVEELSGMSDGYVRRVGDEVETIEARNQTL